MHKLLGVKKLNLGILKLFGNVPQDEVLVYFLGEKVWKTLELSEKSFHIKKLMENFLEFGFCIERM